MNEESSAEISKLWTSKTKDGKKYMAEWLMRYIRAEMVKENGEWRFLHVRVNELLRCPMNSDFVAWSEARFVTDGARLDEQFRSNMPFAPDKPPERMADEPTTFHWQYTWESNSKDLPHLIKGEKKYEV